MNAKILTTIVSIGSLAAAAAGWFDAKTKAIDADNKVQEIVESRAKTKIDRDEEFQNIKTRLSLVEKDCEQVRSLGVKVDKMNETLISIKVMTELLIKEKDKNKER